MCMCLARRKRRGFARAREMSRSTGKPLIVIGSPSAGGWNSLTGPDYGCGDICVDLVGCDACPQSVSKDAIEYLRKLPDNSHVIFESGVLEAVDDRDWYLQFAREVPRVAGNDYISLRASKLSIFRFVYVPYLLGLDKGIGKVVKKNPLPSFSKQK